MTYFIAEVSSNHNQNIWRAMSLIETAAAIGCQAVKFQLFKVDQLFSPEALKAKPHLIERRKWELPVDALATLTTHAHGEGLLFGCTPFYLDAVDELYPYVDFYKIASYQILWTEMLRAVALTGKPIVLSTGMATLDEIFTALNLLENMNCTKIDLLHCVSAYPVPPEQCNLRTIGYLRALLAQRYRKMLQRFGWSDHSNNLGVVTEAVLAQNAEVIEFHLDLEDEAGVESQMAHCWTPTRAKQMLSVIRDAQAARGEWQKTVSSIERVERQWRSDPLDGLRPLKQYREGIAHAT